MASTYGGLARRAKRQGRQDLQCFAASLADIDKALKQKAKLTKADVMTALPPEYRDYIDVFDPDKIAALPPYRPGIDIEIQLEKDAEGKDKEVYWGPLYGMSRDELLVLRKELTSYFDKGFIQASKSPAGAPVLFAKKSGGCYGSSEVDPDHVLLKMTKQSSIIEECRVPLLNLFLFISFCTLPT